MPSHTTGIVVAVLAGALIATAAGAARSARGRRAYSTGYADGYLDAIARHLSEMAQRDAIAAQE